MYCYHNSKKMVFRMGGLMMLRRRRVLIAPHSGARVYPARENV